MCCTITYTNNTYLICALLKKYWISVFRKFRTNSWQWCVLILANFLFIKGADVTCFVSFFSMGQKCLNLLIRRCYNQLWIISRDNHLLDLFFVVNNGINKENCATKKNPEFSYKIKSFNSQKLIFLIKNVWCYPSCTHQVDNIVSIL